MNKLAHVPASNLRRLSSAALLALVGAAAHGQTLYSSSESVGPTESFSVVGDDFLATDVFLVRRVQDDGSLSLPIVAPVISRGLKVAVVKALAAPAGLWRLTVQRGLVESAPLYINRARAISIDTDRCYAGEKVSIYGNNLVGPSNRLPSVTFVAPGGTRLAATVTAAAEHKLTFNAPATIVAGVQYQILVNNGDGSPAIAETALAQRVTGTAAAVNPFNIDVPWNAAYLPAASKVINVMTDSRLIVKAKGDGVTDDSVAIQLALDLAKSLGGGTVSVPAGTYIVDGLPMNGRRSTLDIYPNVVLRGAGMGQTILKFGMRYTPTSAPIGKYWMALYEGGGNGVCDLTAQNLNSSDKVNQTVRRGSGSGNYAENFFFHAVDFQLNNSDMFLMNSVTHGLIKDCKFKYTSIATAPFFFSSASWLKFENNVVAYRIGRVRSPMLSDSQFIGNSFTRDMAYAVDNMPEAGGIETSFGQRVVIEDNTLLSDGQTHKGFHDDEMILTQRSIVPDFQYLGTVGSATSTTLSDLNGAWRTNDWQDPTRPGPNRRYVMIVAGAGAGQWRFITGTDVAARTITVDRPWDVVPNATSTYHISSQTCYQQFYLGNRIIGGTQAISLYSGGMDTVIAGNTLTNAGHIWLRGFSNPEVAGSGLEYNHEPIVGNVVEGNTISAVGGECPTGIVVSAIFTSSLGAYYCTLQNDVRDNSISVTGTPLIRQNMIFKDNGLFVQTVIQGGSAPAFATSGTVFTKNRLSGVASQVFPLRCEAWDFSW